MNIGSKAREATSLSMPMPVSVTSEPDEAAGLDRRASAIVSAGPSSAFPVSNVRVPPLGHRVAGVDGEVDQDLLDPGRVLGERPEVGLEPPLDA